MRLATSNPSEVLENRKHTLRLRRQESQGEGRASAKHRPESLGAVRRHRNVIEEDFGVRGIAE